MTKELSKLPAGKCIVHFEKGDMAKYKKAFSGIACIAGGVSIVTLEFGTKEQVVDEVKYAIDKAAPGGGFLLETGGGIENAKRENVEAMFETARNYGKN
jgi:uroporphyrinogen-III decarboxylase